MRVGLGGLGFVWARSSAFGRKSGLPGCGVKRNSLDRLYQPAVQFPTFARFGYLFDGVEEVPHRVLNAATAHSHWMCSLIVETIWTINAP